MDLAVAPIVQHLAVSLSIIFILYLAVLAIYNLRFSPLHSIPGPWYAAISDLWLSIHVVRLRQCMTVHKLFETYGPIVRIGPNKIAFRDVDSMKSIYTVHKFDKSIFYKCFKTKNGDHTMTALPHAQFMALRKAYSPHYTPTHIYLFQPEIHDYSLELVEILDQADGKVTFECIDLFRHLMVDVVSVTIYGCRLGALKKWSLGVEDPITRAVRDFAKRGIISAFMPGWAWNLACRIPNQRWRQMCDSTEIMAEFGGSRVHKMRNQINTGKLEEVEKMPLIQRLLQYRFPSSNEFMTTDQIISEVVAQTVAGVDTVSITLSYIFWELSRYLNVMRKLQDELDEAMPDRRSIPDINNLHKLSYLSAVVKEGLRIYGAGPSLLERVVPPSTTKGDFFENGYDLMGYMLPANTIVATQAWSMHRDASVFPSPETFIPDRWLETGDNEEELAQMARYTMPFGTGVRICGGRVQAQLLLYVIVAVVARNFNIVAPPDTNEKTMEMSDTFSISPTSKECKLKFVPRKH